MQKLGQTAIELSIFKLVFFSRASCTSSSHRIVGQSIFRADWLTSLLLLQLPLSLEETGADAHAHSWSPPLQLSSWCRNPKKPFAQTPRLFRLYTLLKRRFLLPSHWPAYWLSCASLGYLNWTSQPVLWAYAKIDGKFLAHQRFTPSHLLFYYYSSWNEKEKQSKNIRFNSTTWMEHTHNCDASDTIAYALKIVTLTSLFVTWT
jgi:hypothetical protein